MLPPTPTQEQTLAIQTTTRSLIVEAGAGSGKTWVLVERFLHQLETHDDWPLDAIVAITFTEKAAREMRDRIRRAVERRAHDGQPRWQALRLELEQLRVSTIHSLCARILREHAIAVGLDPRFDVLDEDEAGFMKEEAIRPRWRSWPKPVKKKRWPCSKACASMSCAKKWHPCWASGVQSSAPSLIWPRRRCCFRGGSEKSSACRRPLGARFAVRNR